MTVPGGLRAAEHQHLAEGGLDLGGVVLQVVSIAQQPEASAIRRLLVRKSRDLWKDSQKVR